MQFDSLECRNSRVHLVKAGLSEGEPLLLIHGAPGSWQDWRGLMEGADRLETFKIWAVDRPGFGLSRNSHFDVEFERKVEDLTAVALKLGEESRRPLWIIGHSYGAALAARVAVELSGRVALAGVILISGVMCQWSNHPRWYNRFMGGSPFRLLFPMRYRRGAREMNHVRKGLLSLKDKWADFPCGIGLVHCRDDHLIVSENSEYVRDRASSLIRYEQWLNGVGHRVPQKRPDVVKAALLAMFIEQGCRGERKEGAHVLN